MGASAAGRRNGTDAGVAAVAGYFALFVVFVLLHVGKAMPTPKKPLAVFLAGAFTAAAYVGLLSAFVSVSRKSGAAHAFWAHLAVAVCMWLLLVAPWFAYVAVMILLRLRKQGALTLWHAIVPAFLFGMTWVLCRKVALYLLERLFPWASLW